VQGPGLGSKTRLRSNGFHPALEMFDDFKIAGEAGTFEAAIQNTG
jgi:hypothetical protein